MRPPEHIPGAVKPGQPWYSTQDVPNRPSASLPQLLGTALHCVTCSYTIPPQRCSV